MARARNIKPSFFTSEQLADNDPLGRLLFIGLWTESDFRGNIEWKPRTLKVKLLPFDNCDIEQLAINLDKSGLIRFYSVQGQLYIHIPNFDRHQNPHKNERDKGTEIPEYSNESRQAVDLKELAINLDKNGTAPDKNETTPADSFFLNPESLILIPDSTLPDSGEKKTRDKPARFDPLEIELPDCINPSAWKAWIDYRRSRKLTVAELTIKAQIKNLEAWWNDGQDPASIINQSISQGWQGLFYPKGTAPPSSQQPAMTNAEIVEMIFAQKGRIDNE